MYSSYAFPEHIKLFFCATENALGACTKSVKDQVIVPGVKEHDNRRSRVRGLDLGEHPRGRPGRHRETPPHNLIYNSLNALPVSEDTYLLPSTITFSTW